ncbi:MAG: Prolyl tripeptidyl peptidase precursor [Bacteroidota bacterium]|jgi:hypothetical protein
MRTTSLVVTLLLSAPPFLMAQQSTSRSSVNTTVALMSESIVSERLTNLPFADSLNKADFHETEAAEHTARRIVIRPTDAELSAQLPQPVMVVTAANLSYRSIIQLNGELVSTDMTRQITANNGNWIISEKVTSVFGNSLEINTIDQKDMKPVKRVLENGRLKIELDYTPTMIKGNVVGGSIDRVIALRTEEPILTDGAGIDLVIGSLPLREGFIGYYRTFNPQSHQIKINQVKVVGVERVNVPAGSFDAFKVEFKPINGDEATTFWIEKGRAVKMMTTLTHLNDAVMITELTQSVAN